MKLEAVHIENFKGLKSLDLQDLAGRHLLIVAGRNGAGKSSALDAIESLLAGSRHEPTAPVRRGAKKATACITLEGGFQVEKTWREGGKGQLRVTRDGHAQGNPQAMLSEWFTTVALDPLAFVQGDTKAQRDTLLQLAGVDVAPMDAERKRLYDERTIIGRQQRDAEAQCTPAMVDVARQPDARPIDTGHVLRERDAMLLRNSERERAAEAEREWSEEVRRLEAALEEARNTVREAQTAIAELGPMEDCAPLNQQLADAGRVNELAQQQRVARDRMDVATRYRDEYHSLSAAIDEIDGRKRRALEDAQWPIDGLGVDDTGVTFRGVPLADCSMSEKLRIGVAVATAQRPKLRLVLVRDGSLLDDTAMDALRLEAERHDLQVIVERVGTSDDGAIVIVNGELADAG